MSRTSQSSSSGQPWDSLDIKKLVETVTDGFAEQFYSCGFGELKLEERKAVLRAIARECRELAAGQ